MSVQDFKCPNCGGAITFDPSRQEMTCPYCDSIIDVAAFLTYSDELTRGDANENINWGFKGNEWSEGEQSGLSVYSCESCGGEIVGDETLGATSCPFCGSPVVITSKFSGTLKPDIVIPFNYKKEQVLEALKKHYLKKRLLPKVFKDENHLDEVKGVYVPFWLFDADTDARIRYRGTKLRTWSTSDYRYTETSYYSIHRAGGIAFEQVPIDGSTVMDDTLMESIEPFVRQSAVDFNTAYLSGFFANKYDVDADHSIGRADERIRNSTARVFADTVSGYSGLTPEYTHIDLKTGSIKYGLLPVWLLSTSWEGKNYTFAMNGQTGKFVGDLPLDRGAFAKMFFGIFLGVSAALSGISLIVLNMLP